MIDLSAELLSAAEADIIGLAIIGADRIIRRKVGHLVEWLPAVGEDSCQCILLIGMESELAALSEGRRGIITLSRVRGASPRLDLPLTAVVFWHKDRLHYVVVVMPDFATREIETLIESERRTRRLIEQQLEAASSEVHFASLARTRLRLARDLHDTLAHSIIALLTQIRLIRHFLATDPARVADGLAIAEQAAISGLVRARDAIARLRLPDEPESTPDIESMLSDFAKQTGTDISIDIDIDVELRNELNNHGSTIQRIVHETLRNIELHAKARHVQFRAAVEMGTSGKRLIVEIRDDGQGFDPALPKPEHFGLVGMAEFAALANGKCVVESVCGKGTLVRISLPATLPSTGQLSSVPADAMRGNAGVSKG
jgi:signal transduction histidine kinase